MGLRLAYLRRVWGHTIGEGSRISFKANLDKTSPKGVIIGEYTGIGLDVLILTHDFLNARHVVTRVGSYCMIGARSVICPGVSIGDGCIIGAGSVVMTDIPENCLAIGNPARIVEKNIQTGKWGIRIDKMRKENIPTNPLQRNSEVEVNAKI